MRHGEASDGADDFARPLTASGREAARQAGAQIATFQPSVGVILCSSAPRAATTAELVLEALPIRPRLEQRIELYLAPPSALSEILRELESSIRCALVVGHNPGLSQLASILAGHRVTLSPADYVSYVADVEHWTQLLNG